MSFFIFCVIKNLDAHHIFTGRHVRTKINNACFTLNGQSTQGLDINNTKKYGSLNDYIPHHRYWCQLHSLSAVELQLYDPSRRQSILESYHTIEMIQQNTRQIIKLGLLQSYCNWTAAYMLTLKICSLN